MIKKIILFSIVSLSIISTIGYIFWRQEYRFNLPTPKPENLKIVNAGDSIQLDFLGKKPSFVHFYNYDCPCSRFNITEFRSLVHNFPEINFVAIIETANRSESEIDDFLNKYGLDIPVIKDKSGRIADELGVYSTPQAVIIDKGVLFYKGNYNRAKFCISKNTRFAEQALTALLEGTAPPIFPELAYIPYGCELPSEERSTSLFSLLSL